MDARTRWSRILCIVGLVAMVIGFIDPLEGSFIILPGSGLVALAAFLGRSRFCTLACWAFGLTVVGVGILVVLSMYGGVGGETGRSWWWLLTVLPYPVGAIMALVSGVRMSIESFRH